MRRACCWRLRSRTRFDLPVLSGISEEQPEPARAERVKAMSDLLGDLGPQAQMISEVNAASLEDLRVTTQMDQHAIELWMGDRNYAPRFQNFMNHYPEIHKNSPQSAAVFDLRLDDRITDEVERIMSNKPLLAVGLDAGSRHTRAVICTLEQDRLRFLGCGDVPSRGWAKSRIADQQAVSECILEAVQHAEAAAHTLVESVTAGFGGVTVRGANTRSKHELGRPREIQQADVNTALKRASKVQLSEDRMILQLFPQDFVVDDHPGPSRSAAHAGLLARSERSLGHGVGEGTQRAGRRDQSGAPVGR